MLQFQRDNAKMKRPGRRVNATSGPNRNGSYEDHVMAKKALPSPEVLRQLLRYEPETGKLFWLPRIPEWFSTSPARSVEHACRIWNAKHANKHAICDIDSGGYLRGSILGVKHRAHRVVWAMHYGEWPNGSVDHRDGDKTNNRLSNLRLANHSQNGCNRGPSQISTSGEKGVSWNKRRKKWEASISVNGDRRWLGLHISKSDAAAAYARASAELHGEFARVR